MTDIRFEWDEAKNRSNQQKHDGVSFEVASQVFRDPLHISIQDRVEIGERRWQTIGSVGGYMLLLVAHTTSEDDALGGVVEIIRIISARRATVRERKQYENENG
ncbi:membrane protein (plasmid) [Agrobacterium vitis]|uniref:BrnT family toxin n=1 Tax=Agrobacterium vitis TaxID=373 RepID=UPI0015D9D2C5|nr:BrnT family toxin [Agrobacterium vitis]BCH68440.1 membrane protein [Agrobacterium vitis]